MYEGRPLAEVAEERGVAPRTAYLRIKNGYTDPAEIFATGRMSAGRGAPSAKRKPKAPPDYSATHCKHGHEFTSETSYFEPSGKRKCRICTREAVRRHAAKHRNSAS